ncbi:MAG: hypothetical protein ACTHK4_12630 [Mycobacteriales bacterium]
MADNDDRPRDPSSAPGQHADAPWSDVVVPDDLRDLARDVAAYRREVRRADRARRLRRLLARRGAVPALVLTGAVVLAAIVAGLLAAMAPRTVIRAPAAEPLAASPAAAGTIGGLLPPATLAGPNGPISTRSATLRPAVFALVPRDCGCRSLLNSLSGQAYGEGLQLAIVVPAATDPSTADLANTLRGEPSVYYDASATLATSMTGRGVTVVVINRDGTIYDVQRGVTDPTSTSLDAALQSMLLPDRP